MTVKRMLGLTLLAAALLAAGLAPADSAPDYPALFARAEQALDAGDVSKAIELFTACLGFRERLADVYSNLGYAHYARKAFRESLRWYSLALELRPLNFGLISNIGSVLNDLGDKTGLETFLNAQLRAARRDAPETVPLLVYLLLGFDVDRVGSVLLAVELTRRGAGHPLLLYGMACAYAREARTHDLALDHLVQAVAQGYTNVAWVERDPDFASLRSNAAWAGWTGVLRGIVAADAAADTATTLAGYLRVRAAYPASGRAGAGFALVTWYAGLHATQARRFDEAVTLLREAAALQRGFEPRGRHPRYATSLNSLGDAFMDAGRLADAEAPYRESRRIRRDFEPAGRSREYAASCINLGLLCKKTGRLAEAEPLYLEGLAIYKGQSPPGKSESYATSCNNLGLLYDEMGRHADAEPLLREAVAIRAELPPRGRHPEYAASLCTLAELYQSMLRYADAEPLFKAAVAIRAGFDPAGRHPDYAAALNSLGSAYWKMGRFSDAEPRYLAAIAIRAGLEPKGNHPDLAASLNNLGATYEELGRQAEAEARFRAALAIRKTQAPAGRHPDYATSLNRLGLLCKSMARYGEAERFYLEAIRILKDTVPAGRHPEYANGLNNLGALYEEMGRYAEAEPLYKAALDIYRGLAPAGGHPDFAMGLNNLGLLYESMGRFAEAERLMKDALGIRAGQPPRGRHPRYADSLNNLAALYYQMGRYEAAEPLHKGAIAIRRELEPRGRHPDYAVSLNNLGTGYRNLGRYAETERLYKEALSILRECEPKGRHPGYATSLNNLALLYASMERYAEVVPLYREAMAIYAGLEPRGRHPLYALALNNLGNAYSDAGRFAEAAPLCRAALEIRRDLEPRGRHPSYANSLNSMGALHYLLREHTKAIPFLEEAVTVNEYVRARVADASRREYFATLMGNYQWLVLARVALGHHAAAFDTRELASAKYLREQLAAQSGRELAAFDSAKRCATLEADTAVVSYANSEWNEMVIFVADRRGVTGTRVDISAAGAALLKAHAVDLDKLDGATGRGVLYEEQGKPGAAGADRRRKSNLDRLVTLYRWFLQDPARCRRSSGVPTPFQELSAELYRILVQPVAAKLAGKKKLLVLPDGVLGFLPFETLLGPDGKYLVEKHEIGYAFSLGVQDELAARRAAAPKRVLARTPFLGFGGAVYDEAAYSKDMSGAPAVSHDELLALLDRGQSASLYGKLRWGNLPGTLHEVREIQSVLGGAVITNAAVSEGELKRLSREGALRRCEVLHFATHGLLVPEVPELSALVLSLGSRLNPAGDGVRPEDGYLQTREILKLDLDCEFVNLSACETGLGKIVKGEGIVGLTQAFLLAGARALSVSLWKIHDEASMVFMVGLYSLVKETKCTYREALARMKRQFIEGGKYAAPYYWGAFAYWGE